MNQNGNTALQMARKHNKQPVAAYLSATAEMKRQREEEERKRRERQTEMKRQREEEEKRQRHEQAIIAELRRLCELGNASAVTDLLLRETATTIACTTALSTAEVGI